MLVEPDAHRDKTSTHRHEIVKVNGAALGLDKLGHHDRQHRTSDDAGFDERAGVQSNNGGAVKDGIEVVSTGPFIDWIAAPHDGIELADVNRLPFRNAGWMRPHEYAD